MRWSASPCSSRTSRAGPAGRGLAAAARALGAAADGSTLLEVLAALLIMSILGLGMWSAVSACLRLTTKIHDSTMASTRILNIDDRLRDLAGRVRAPFWVPDFLIETTETEMHVAYLDGDPSKSLILKADGGALSIDDGSTVKRYPGFQRVTMAAAQDSAGKTCGITVSLEKKGGESFSVMARFGSTPVTAGAAP